MSLGLHTVDCGGLPPLFPAAPRFSFALVPAFSMENPRRYLYNIWMNFGPALPELLPGARNAIETCLAIQPHERVALIADRPSQAVAASLATALDQRGAICEGFLLEDLATRPITRAPQQ